MREQEAKRKSQKVKGKTTTQNEKFKTGQKNNPQLKVVGVNIKTGS